MVSWYLFTVWFDTNIVTSVGFHLHEIVVVSLVLSLYFSFYVFL